MELGGNVHLVHLEKVMVLKQSIVMGLVKEAITVRLGQRIKAYLALKVISVQVVQAHPKNPFQVIIQFQIINILKWVFVVVLRINLTNNNAKWDLIVLVMELLASVQRACMVQRWVFLHRTVVDCVRVDTSVRLAPLPQLKFHVPISSLQKPKQNNTVHLVVVFQSLHEKVSM
jgi:hypothetical protein